jgi:hypothetical protein
MNYCLIFLGEKLMTKLISKKEAERLKRLKERKARKQDLSLVWAMKYLKRRGYRVNDYYSSDKPPAEAITLSNGVKAYIDKYGVRLYRKK